MNYNKKVPLDERFCCLPCKKGRYPQDCPCLVFDDELDDDEIPIYGFCKLFGIDAKLMVETVNVVMFDLHTQEITKTFKEGHTAIITERCLECKRNFPKGFRVMNLEEG